jgi:putative hydrolase of the HAD superfamily
MKIIFFDADDTLWGGIQEVYDDARRNLVTFIRSRFDVSASYILERFNQEDYLAREKLDFSRHRFPTSAVRTFVSIANEQDGEITSNDILDVYMIADRVFDLIPELKAGVESTISTLNRSGYTCKILTLGDPIMQSSKIYRSGIHEYIKDSIIVPRKDVNTYLDIAHKYEDCGPLIMVGDSVGNDINPALEAGWYAIHIPVEYRMYKDVSVINSGEGRFFTVDNIKGVIDVVGSIFEGSERV